MNYSIDELPDGIRERIEIDPVEGCWRWAGRLTPDGRNGGYGVVQYKGKQWRVHRLVWTLLIGDIPPGMHCSHHDHDLSVQHGGCEGGPTCRHRRCCNPSHIALATPQGNAENIRRAMGRDRVCSRGHVLAEVGGYYIKKQHKKQPYRQCRECRRVERRTYNKRRRTAHRDTRGAST